jgi:hypothetical protein
MRCHDRCRRYRSGVTAYPVSVSWEHTTGHSYHPTPLHPSVVHPKRQMGPRPRGSVRSYGVAGSFDLGCS